MSSEAPPSYDAVASGAASKSAERRPPRRQESNIPVADRRSIEDSIRPLPDGWIRQWDPQSHHNFFVDTKAKPPRSIWQHPLDDEQFLREHAEEAKRMQPPQMPEHHGTALDYETTDEEEGNGAQPTTSKSTKPPPTGMKKFGQSVKNKLTNSTHEERVAQRKKQRELEQKAYEQHQAIRAAMIRATQTGQPQLIGRDKQGREIFAQPPPPNDPYMGANVGYGPYQTAPAYPYGSGMYRAPMGPYGRRPGYGYGGGMGGMGMGMPLMGGLAGGMLLGGLMF